MPSRLLKILLALAAVIVAAGAYLYFTQEAPQPEQRAQVAPAAVDKGGVWTGTCDQEVRARYFFGATSILIGQIRYRGLDRRFTTIEVDAYVLSPNAASRKSALAWIPAAFELTNGKLQWRGVPTRVRDRGDGEYVKAILRFVPRQKGAPNRGIPTSQLKKRLVGLSLDPPMALGQPVILGLQPPVDRDDPANSSCENRTTRPAPDAG